MIHKDTLEMYDELLAGGCTEAQARVQAKQLGIIGDELSNAINNQKNYLENVLTKFQESIDRIDNRLILIDKDLFWMRVIGGAMTVSFLSGVIAALFK